MNKKKKIFPTPEQQEELLRPWIKSLVTMWLRYQGKGVLDNHKLEEYSIRAEDSTLRYLKGAKPAASPLIHTIDIKIPKLIYKKFRNTFPEVREDNMTIFHAACIKFKGFDVSSVMVDIVNELNKQDLLGRTRMEIESKDDIATITVLGIADLNTARRINQCMEDYIHSLGGTVIEGL